NAGMDSQHLDHILLELFPSHIQNVGKTPRFWWILWIILGVGVLLQEVVIGHTFPHLHQHILLFQDESCVETKQSLIGNEDYLGSLVDEDVPTISQGQIT